MNIITERRIINLNSEDATTYNNGSFLSDVNFNFRGLLKDETNMIWCEGGILNAQIPVSFYQIAYYNNTLVYNVGGSQFSITVPVGNYNFSTFSTALQTQFLTNGHTFYITISETTGKLQFSLISGGMGFIFYGLASGTTIFKILGFDPTQNYPDDGSNNLLAPYLLNLLGPKKLKISSVVFSNNSSDTTNYATSNIITTLSVDAPSYGLIVYNNLSDSYGKLKVRRIDNIDIQIKDEYGNFINFNQTDWSITLVLLIYRKMEYRNTDLSNILNTLQDIDTNINYLAESQQPQDQNIQDQIQQDQTNEIQQNVLEQPQQNMDDTTDLDLLLYENPNLFQ